MLKLAYSNQGKAHIVGSTLAEEVHREIRNGRLVAEIRGNYVAICGQSLNDVTAEPDPVLTKSPEDFGRIEGDCKNCKRSFHARENI